VDGEAIAEYFLSLLSLGGWESVQSATCDLTNW